MFGAGHAVAKNQLQPLVEKKYISAATANILAGGIGGGFQGFVLSPTLLLKTRVMTDPVFREDLSLLKVRLCARCASRAERARPSVDDDDDDDAQTTQMSMTVGMRVIRNEGVLALMKGSGVFSLKRVGDWVTRYYFATATENLLFRRADAKRKVVAPRARARARARRMCCRRQSSRGTADCRRGDDGVDDWRLPQHAGHNTG